MRETTTKPETINGRKHKKVSKKEQRGKRKEKKEKTYRIKNINWERWIL